MSFFKKLAGSGKTLLKKVSGGVDTTLRKIGNTAGDIGAGLDKGVPMLSMIDPELGAGLASVSQGFQQGKQMINQGRDASKSMFNAGAGKLDALSNKATGMLGQANLMKNNLLSQGTNLMGQAQSIKNQAMSGDMTGAIQRAKDVSSTIQPPQITFV
jgi:hypothetical protein